MIVHGGHAEDEIAAGPGRWVRSLEMLESEVPVLIENTAGGENAVARRFDALARLWEALAAYRGRLRSASASTPATPTRPAKSSPTRSRERTRSPAGSTSCTPTTRATRPARGADRHARLARARSIPTALPAMIRAGGALGAPILVETPGPRAGIRADLDFVREALGPAGRARSVAERHREVVAGDDGEHDRVEPVEQAAVGAEDRCPSP